jgi:hypothetical protein
MNASFLWTNSFVTMEDPLPDEFKWEMIRLYRNGLLARCDWTQLGDAPLTLEEKQAWSTYRQGLRNIPEDFTSPDDVVFPGAPGGAA